MYVAKLLIMHVTSGVHAHVYMHAIYIPGMRYAWHVMSSRAISQLAFLWLLQMSRARFAQHMCTCTGWIASKRAKGFAQ